MTWDFILRLFIAGALGAVIGLDREYRAKRSRLSHSFSCVTGQCTYNDCFAIWLFMEIIKIEGIDLDPSRVAAQVVSGIGFMRRRHYHFSEANSAWINNGCRYMGYLRYRTRSRSRNVLAGDFGYYSYFNRFGGIELSFLRVSV